MIPEPAQGAGFLSPFTPASHSPISSSLKPGILVPVNKEMCHGQTDIHPQDLSAAVAQPAADGAGAI
ncbi:TPA: hypothetical protein ACNUUK_004407, partial [Aeromonas salmonicida subsp. smithia]